MRVMPGQDFEDALLRNEVAEALRYWAGDIEDDTQEARKSSVMMSFVPSAGSDDPDPLRLVMAMRRLAEELDDEGDG